MKETQSTGINKKMLSFMALGKKKLNVFFSSNQKQYSSNTHLVHSKFTESIWKQCCKTVSLGLKLKTCQKNHPFLNERLMFCYE